MNGIEGLRQLPQKYGMVFLGLSILLSLLNCFFGYKLLRLWTTLLGFLIGAVGAYLAASAFGFEMTWAVLIGFVGGTVVGALSFSIYRFGVFLFTFIMGLGMGLQLFQQNEIAAWISGVLLGIGFAILSVSYIRQIVIVSSSLSGGINAGADLITLFHISDLWVSYLIEAVLVILGILVQLRTTQKKRYR